MNVDRILSALAQCEVRYLLIGGMNYLLRHEPVLTYDVDVWVRDEESNLRKCEDMLSTLDAAWGETEEAWGPVKDRSHGWLAVQSVFCLTSPFGSIDIFRTVKGLDSWDECARRAVHGNTAGGIPYVGLSNEDMLRCQLALDESERKPDRIRKIEAAIAKRDKDDRRDSQET